MSRSYRFEYSPDSRAILVFRRVRNHNEEPEPIRVYQTKSLERYGAHFADRLRYKAWRVWEHYNGFRRDSLRK